MNRAAQITMDGAELPTENRWCPDVVLLGS
jgi:hypothetical protein